MKKTLIVIAALAALVSCKSLKEEWQPVVCGPDTPDAFVPYTVARLQNEQGLQEFTTIADLKALYSGAPVVITGNVWIAGQVVSSDRTGNIYKELYLQDATGAIDIKMGKNNMYAEYFPGQWVYVKCDGLTLGAYNGMPQLGMASDDTSTNTYDTSYIDLQALIDLHVFRGAKDTPLEPQVVSEAEIKASVDAAFHGELWGKLVTIKGAQYGAEPSYNGDPYKRIFVFLNVDPYKDKIQTFNRMRLSTSTYNVTTWAMSKANFLAHLDAGDFDSAVTYDGVGMDDVFDEQTGATVKETLRANATGVTTSQYFHMGSEGFAIRTSGFAKFADEEIDPAILGTLTEQDGAQLNVTGILSYYDGSPIKTQIALVDEPSVSIEIL